MVWGIKIYVFQMRYITKWSNKISGHAKRVKALKKNQKDPRSDPTRQSTRLRDPT